MIYTHVAAAIIGAAIAGAGVWKVQGWRYDAQISDMRATASESSRLALRAAAKDSTDLQRKKGGAIHEATKRAQSNAADAAAARTESDRLRDELAASRTRMPGASCASVREHAAALNELFGNCSRALEDLAGKAQGHASDALMFEQAWPTAPKN